MKFLNPLSLIFFLFFILSTQSFSADPFLKFDNELNLPIYCQMTYKGRVTDSEEKKCASLRSKQFKDEAGAQVAGDLKLKSNSFETNLPFFCRMTYKGQLSTTDQEMCLSLRNKVVAKIEKTTCEEVTEAYVICNGNRYDLSKTAASTLLRQMKKLERPPRSDEVQHKDTDSK